MKPKNRIYPKYVAAKGLPGGPQGTLGDPQGGGKGAQKGPKRAPKAALGDTFGKRGDIAKSLFLLHEMVHFGLWRGAWAGPMATKRGRGHHMEPDDRSEEEKTRPEGAG